MCISTQYSSSGDENLHDFIWVANSFALKRQIFQIQIFEINSEENSADFIHINIKTIICGILLGQLSKTHRVN